MAAATVRASYFGASGTEPAGSTAETGIVFSRSDAKAPSAGTSPIPKPTATGTAFSWIMQLALEVTATGTTSITNRKIAASGAFTSGLNVFFGVQGTYRQPASGNKPSDSGSNGATPATAGAGAPASYAAVTTTPATVDNASVATSGAGRNGGFAECVFAVDNTYAGGAGAISLGNLLFTYDEA